MVLPTPNSNPALPIPNNPFYTPETYLVQGAYNNLIIGQNLFVDQTGCLSATPGGPIGTVYSVGVGTGLCTTNPGSSPITGAGNIALVNFGPGAGITNYPSSITLDAKGRVAGITAGNIPVTSVGAGTGLCTSLPGNAAITTTGFISLCALNPNPTGTFANATVTVNAYGQVTGAVAGTAPVTTVNGTLPIVVTSGANTNVSVNAATSSTCGVVHGCTAATSTALGVGAGSGANFASSGNNVALGVNANVSSWTGTQLAIGSNNGNWLTGCNDLSIKPGAGIRDNADSLGNANQVLVSTGSNGISWATPISLVSASKTLVYGTGTCLSYCGLEFRLPLFGNSSLQVNTVSGNAVIYMSTNASSTGSGSISVNGFAFLLTSAPAYFNGALNYGGFTNVAGIQAGMFKMNGGSSAVTGTYEYTALMWNTYAPDPVAFYADFCVTKIL